MKNFSQISFFIGAAAGLVIGTGLGVSATLSFIQGGGGAQLPIAGESITNAIQQRIDGQQLATSLSGFGKVGSITADHMTVGIVRGTETTSTTFRYDSKTSFYTLAHDTASTRVPIDPSTVQPGDSVIVRANEAIGSVDDQYIYEVFKP